MSKGQLRIMTTSLVGIHCPPIPILTNPWLTFSTGASVLHLWGGKQRVSFLMAVRIELGWEPTNSSTLFWAYFHVVYFSELLYLLVTVDPYILLCLFINSIGYSERLSHPNMGCLNFDNLRLLTWKRFVCLFVYSTTWTYLTLLRKESGYWRKTE